MTPEELNKLQKNQITIIENQAILNNKLDKILIKLEAVISNQIQDGADLARIQKKLEDRP